jgi:predicted oxidoreductase
MSRFEHIQQALAELVDELDHADRLSAEQAERLDALEADNRRLREALTVCSGCAADGVKCHGIESSARF